MPVVDIKMTASEGESSVNCVEIMFVSTWL